MERTISPERLALELNGKQILDVRRAADFAVSSEKLEGAVWLDPGDVQNWSESLGVAQEYVIYCVRGGSVSNAVLDVLQEKGVRARYIEGGIEGWKASGGSVIPKECIAEG